MAPVQPPDAWMTYPEGLACFDSAEIDTREAEKCFDDPESLVFSDEDDINVRVIDIENGKATSDDFKKAEDLWQRLKAPHSNAAHVRIISIYSAKTYRPLQVDSTLMRKILHTYEVDPNFVRVLSTFGDQPHIAEAGSSFFSYRPGTQGETRTSYVVNYVEENHRGEDQPWSIRHTGVYHHHQAKADLFILLHGTSASVLDQRISTMIGLEQEAPEQKRRVTKFCSDPYRLHHHILSSFLGNWKHYLRWIGDKFENQSDIIMTTKPEEANASTTFKMVQRLRDTLDDTLMIRACCASNLDLVNKLHDGVTGSQQNLTHLASRKAMVQNYIDSTDAMIQRMKNALDLAGYTLTIHNQMETAKVDHNLLDVTKELRDVTEKLRELTQSTVDDSATVKIITLVSAFYLPGSFVGTMYGMNFFMFNRESNSISIADDAWIFAATWIPLTLLTFAAYWFIRRTPRKK